MIREKLSVANEKAPAHGRGFLLKRLQPAVLFKTG